MASSSPGRESYLPMSSLSSPLSSSLSASGTNSTAHPRAPAIVSSDDESEPELSIKSQFSENSNQQSPGFDTRNSTSRPARQPSAEENGISPGGSRSTSKTGHHAGGGDSNPIDGRGPDLVARSNMIFSPSFHGRGSDWGSVFDSDSTSHSGYDSGKSGRIDSRKSVHRSHMPSLSPEGRVGGLDWDSDNHGLTENNFRTSDVGSPSSRGSHNSGGDVKLLPSPDTVGAVFGGDLPSSRLSTPTVGLPPVMPPGPPTTQYEELTIEVGPGVSRSDTRDSPAPKGSAPSAEESRPKRVRINGRRRGEQIDRFNPGYVKLLNETISLANSREICLDKGKRLSGSFILGSWWTPEEKSEFFSHLAVSGRDSAALSKAMGTKSIIECRAYLEALREGIADRNNRIGKDGRLLELHDIPAAAEISNECIEALDKAAQLVEDRTLRDEEKREKVRWGNFWILDPLIAGQIEALYAEDEIEDIHDIAPEAELLNIDGMLQLSKCIFMNSSEDNWQDLSENPPSIRYTAFVDLHTLVVNLTRRIVSTTLFMTESRLRNTAAKIFHPQRIVKPCDAKAAVQCLGLPLNSRDYWVKFPRRSGFKVLFRKRNEGSIVPYDEVECFPRAADGMPRGKRSDWLDVSGEDYEGDANSQNTDNCDEDRSAEGDTESLSSAWDAMGVENHSDSEVYCNSSDDSVPSAGVEHRPGKERRRLEAEGRGFEAEEDLYLEALDQNHSLHEERQLWEILGEEPNKALDGEVDLPKPPPRQRKRPADLVDWMDSLEYIAPWESVKKTRLERGERTQVGVVPISSAAQVRAPRLGLNSVAPQANDSRGRSATSLGPGISLRNNPPKVARRSPRKPRARRPVVAFSGYVSTVENVQVDNDLEASGYENQDDESEVSEHQEMEGRLG